MTVAIRACLCALAFIAAIAAAPAEAHTVLEWAHVYPTREQYHTDALCAAEQLKRRPACRYEIRVRPGGQLGNENQINEGLGLGAVDIIYTGVAFVGATHKPLAMSNAPYV